MKIFIPYEITDIETHTTILLKEEDGEISTTEPTLTVLGRKQIECEDVDDDIDDVAAQYVNIDIQTLDPAHRIALANALQILVDQVRNFQVQ